MPFSTFVSKERTPAEELSVLNSLKFTMESKCGFHFVKTGPKTRKFAIQRQLLAYTAFKHGVRISHIAAFLGYSSHQSVIHAIKLIDGLLSYDKNIKQLARSTDENLDADLALGLLTQNSYQI